jgi:hypothetical protein
MSGSALRVARLADPEDLRVRASESGGPLFPVLVRAPISMRYPLFDKAPRLWSLLQTRTLDELANASQCPLTAFRHLSPEAIRGMANLDNGQTVELIKVPDPEFAPYLAAARFFADALVAPGLPNPGRSRLIQSSRRSAIVGSLLVPP